MSTILIWVVFAATLANVGFTIALEVRRSRQKRASVAAAVQRLAKQTPLTIAVDGRRLGEK